MGDASSSQFSAARPAYASMLYMLRNHIDLVREGLKKHADKVAE
jgi:hypothetical protein